jgi:hypothetical protein
MAERSAVALLGILQRQGLKTETLLWWAVWCEHKLSGALCLHVCEGHITSAPVHIVSLEVLRRGGLPQSTDPVSLLGILQRHGLLREALALWVDFCERKESGDLSVHVCQGHCKSYTVQVCGKLDALRKDGLSKVTHASRDTALSPG